MELSLRDFYNDLFRSFRYNKELIDEQIERDFERLHFYMNGKQIYKKGHFYAFLKGCKLPRIFKRCIWVLPNQATLYPFYQYLHNKYAKKQSIIAEISDTDRHIDNNFLIHVNTIDMPPQIHIHKNFRIIRTIENGQIATIGYIYLSVDFKLGKYEKLKINIKEDLKFNHIE